MEEEHHDTDYEQDVDQPSGNVKSKKAQQPKHNQNRCNKSKHVFNSLTSARENEETLFSRRARMPGVGIRPWLRVPD
jgi:hypothetical protein